MKNKKANPVVEKISVNETTAKTLMQQYANLERVENEFKIALNLIANALNVPAGWRYMPEEKAFFPIPKQ
jgi:hypothetical protein